jgi:hypothetical protein
MFLEEQGHMTPHISGTSLSAQVRYAAGVREILECWFSYRPIRDEYLIVHSGKLAGVGAHLTALGTPLVARRKLHGSKKKDSA